MLGKPEDPASVGDPQAVDTTTWLPLRLPTRLTVCGLDDLAGHAGSGITDVLSILDPDWPEPEGFGAWRGYRRQTLHFHDAIRAEPGIILPRQEDVAAILAFGRGIGAAAEPHLLVHCHFGISRSTAALTALLADAHRDLAEDEIIRRLVEVRPQSWPNSVMVQFADEQLGRGGRLVTAVRRLYGQQLGRKPHLAELMRELGRDAEVDAAIA